MHLIDFIYFLIFTLSLISYSKQELLYPNIFLKNESINFSQSFQNPFIHKYRKLQKFFTTPNRFNLFPNIHNNSIVKWFLSNTKQEFHTYHVWIYPNISPKNETTDSSSTKPSETLPRRSVHSSPNTGNCRNSLIHLIDFICSLIFPATRTFNHPFPASSQQSWRKSGAKRAEFHGTAEKGIKPW